MNMKVIQHVKNNGLKKKCGFIFGEGWSIEKKKTCAIIVGRKKENMIDGIGKSRVVKKSDTCHMTSKRPRIGSRV